MSAFSCGMSIAGAFDRKENAAGSWGGISRLFGCQAGGLVGVDPINQRVI